MENLNNRGCGKWQEREADIIALSETKLTKILKRKLGPIPDKKKWRLLVREQIIPSQAY